MPKRCFFYFGLCVYALANVASAQVSSINSVPRVPSTGYGRFLFLEESFVLAHGDWVAGTLVDTGFQNVEAKDRGVVIHTVLTRVVAQHFYASLGLFNLLQLNFNVPLIWMYAFTAPSLTPSPLRNFYARLGDPSLDAKLRLLDTQKGVLGISILNRTTFPLGVSQHFLSEGSFTHSVFLILDSQLTSDLFFSIQGGFKFRNSVSVLNVRFNTQFVGGAGLTLDSYNLPVSLSLEVDTTTPLDRLFSDPQVGPITFRAGIHWPIEEHKWIVHLGGSGTINFGTGHPVASVFAGIRFLQI
jgi:hypothetical protein